jgi:hypothetical protein
MLILSDGESAANISMSLPGENGKHIELCQVHKVFCAAEVLVWMLIICMRWCYGSCN